MSGDDAGATCIIKDRESVEGFGVLLEVGLGEHQFGKRARELLRLLVEDAELGIVPEQLPIALLCRHGAGLGG